MYSTDNEFILFIFIFQKIDKLSFVRSYGFQSVFATATQEI